MAQRFSTIWMDSVDSTNSEIVRRLPELDNLSVIAAVDQTAGRGQRGNSWKVEPGANLTFSVLLRFGGDGLAPVHAREQFCISMATALAQVEYFASRGIAASVKWPNDIYCRNRKISGVLIENTLSGSGISRSIIGIGMNVNQTEFPPQLLNPVSMAVLTGKRYDVRGELDAFLPILGRHLEMIQTEEGRKKVAEKYLEHMYAFGESRTFIDCSDGKPFTGKITGVTPEGRLRIETAEGALREFAFKEVSFVL